MRNLLIAIIFSNLVLSCSTQNKQELKEKNILSNTKWECKIAEGYVNFFEFKEDSSYVSYSSEVDEYVYGYYSVKGNYVFLEQIKGEFDNEFPKNSRHRTQHVKFKLRIKDGAMRYIERWELGIDGEWNKSDFKFDDAYSYKKVN